MTLLDLLLILTGLFSLGLGLIHFWLPAFLRYRVPLLDEAAAFEPFRVPLTRYESSRQDLLGIIWVMNHAASFTLVSIGLVDVLGFRWLQGAGWPLSLWFAGWWLIRAGSQFYLGQRTGDRIIAGGFGLLALIQGGVLL